MDSGNKGKGVSLCVSVGREEWSGEGSSTETWEVSWIARMALLRGEVDGLAFRI